MSRIKTDLECDIAVRVSSENFLSVKRYCKKRGITMATLLRPVIYDVIKNLDNLQWEHGIKESQHIVFCRQINSVVLPNVNDLKHTVELCNRLNGLEK